MRLSQHVESTKLPVWQRQTYAALDPALPVPEPPQPVLTTHSAATSITSCQSSHSSNCKTYLLHWVCELQLLCLVHPLIDHAPGRMRLPRQVNLYAMEAPQLPSNARHHAGAAHVLRGDAAAVEPLLYAPVCKQRKDLRVGGWVAVGGIQQGWWNERICGELNMWGCRLMLRSHAQDRFELS